MSKGRHLHSPLPAPHGNVRNVSSRILIVRTPKKAFRGHLVLKGSATGTLAVGGWTQLRRGRSNFVCGDPRVCQVWAILVLICFYIALYGSISFYIRLYYSVKVHGLG